MLVFIRWYQHFDDFHIENLRFAFFHHFFFSRFASIPFIVDMFFFLFVYGLASKKHCQFHMYGCILIWMSPRKKKQRVCRPHSPCKYSMNLRCVSGKKKLHRSNEANMLNSAKRFIVFFFNLLKNPQKNSSIENKVGCLKEKVWNQTPEINFRVLFRQIKSIKLE